MLKRNWKRNRSAGGPALLAACLMALLLLSACGGHGGGLPDASESGAVVQPLGSEGQAADAAFLEGGAMPQLPAPAEIGRAASNAATDSARVRAASQTFIDLQYGLTNGNSDNSTCFSPGGMVFTPAPEAPGLAGSAWAMYLPTWPADYSGPQRIQLGWFSAPQAGKLYVGLANWDSGRWDWFAMPEKLLSPANFKQNYVRSSDGAIAICVMVSGGTPAVLDYVLAGGPIAPQLYVSTNLTATPEDNYVPYNADFTFRARLAGSEIPGFNVDIDNDGDYDFPEIKEDNLHISYLTPKHFTVKVSIVDSWGIYAFWTQECFVVQKNALAPNAALIISPPLISGPQKVTLDATASGSAQGSIVRYEWDVDGDGKYDFNTGTTPKLDYTFGEAGINTINLKVTNDNLLTDETSAGLVVQSGWGHSIIANFVNLQDKPSVAMIGPAQDRRPAVAFQSVNGSEHSLRFVRANDDAGSSWGSVTDPTLADADDGYGPALLDLGGIPFIAYGLKSGGGYSLMALRALDSTVSFWLNPIPAFAGHEAGTKNAAAVIDGLPAILTVENPGVQGSCSLQYLRGKDSGGFSWDSPLELVASHGGQQLRNVDLMAFGKQPLAAWSLYNSVGESVHSRLGNTGGTLWDSPHNWLDASADSLDLVPDNGGVLLGIHSDTQGHTSMLVDSPGNAASWGDFEPVDGPACSPASFGSLAMIGGKPALALYHLGRGDLMYCRATDAAGSNWGDIVSVAAHGNCGKLCQLVETPGGHPLIVYVEQGFQFQTLKAAYL